MARTGRGQGPPPALPEDAPTQLDGALRAAATHARAHADLRATVGAVRGAATLLDPSPDVRRRMRARLLAEPPPRTPRPRTARLLAALAVVVVLLVSAVGPVLAARPGDVLVGVRHAAEDAAVAAAGVTGHEVAAELWVAARRLDDVAVLAGRAGGAAAAEAALDDALDQVRAASRAATRDAVAGASEVLVVLHDWAVARSWEQAEVPGSAVPGRSRAALLEVVARTDALALRLDCREITAGADGLGPLPATAPCRPPGSGPAGSGPVDVAGLRAAG